MIVSIPFGIEAFHRINVNKWNEVEQKIMSCETKDDHVIINKLIIISSTTYVG